MARNNFTAAVAPREQCDAASPLAETACLLGDARTADSEAAPAEAPKLAEAERRHLGGPYSDDARAFALQRAGWPTGAQAVRRSLLPRGTRDATLWYPAGALALADDDETGGRDLPRRALDLDPAFDPTGAREAREPLARP